MYQDIYTKNSQTNIAYNTWIFIYVTEQSLVFISHNKHKTANTEFHCIK